MMTMMTMIAMSELDKNEVAYPQVSRGVAWLDENYFGWADRIDLDSLSLCSLSRCVVCQITGLRYSQGWESLRGAEDECGNRLLKYNEDEQMGFDHPSGMNIQDWWVSAEKLWEDAIKARKTEGYKS